MATSQMRWLSLNYRLRSLSGGKRSRTGGPVEKRASGARGAGCCSVGSFAFHGVFQYRTSLRVNAYLVLRFLVADKKRVTQSAAAGILLKLFRNDFARVRF